MKKEEKLLEYATKIFGADEDNKLYVLDKLGSKPYVDRYNALAKDLGLKEEIVWDEEGIEVPGRIYGTNKKPGYAKVPVVKTVTKEDIGGMSADLLQRYKEKYPNRSEEEIKTAYNRSK